MISYVNKIKDFIFYSNFLFNDKERKKKKKRMEVFGFLF